MAEEERNPVSFSFAGCGFLGIYHIGVVSCLREHCPHFLPKAKFAGASAGSLIAACVICDVPLNQMARFVFSLAKIARNGPMRGWEPSCRIGELLRRNMDEVLPPDAHEICTDRLFVSVTKLNDRDDVDFPLKNLMISKFESKNHLLDVLMCSAFVPCFSGYKLPVMNGHYMLDGGLTNNIPKVDKDTITVCPIAGEHSICPKSNSEFCFPVTVCEMSVLASVENLRRMMHAFHVPDTNKMLNYCWGGYGDALDYLTENCLIHCRGHKHRLVMTHLKLWQNVGRNCGDCQHNCDHARHAQPDRTVIEEVVADEIATLKDQEEYPKSAKPLPVPKACREHCNGLRHRREFQIVPPEQGEQLEQAEPVDQVDHAEQNGHAPQAARPPEDNGGLDLKGAVCKVANLYVEAVWAPWTISKWIGAWYCAQLKARFIYVKKLLKNLMLEVYAVIMLCPGRLKELWAQRREIMRQVLSGLKQVCSLQTWYSWMVSYVVFVFHRQVPKCGDFAENFDRQVQKFSAEWHGWYLDRVQLDLEKCPRCLLSLADKAGKVVRVTFNETCSLVGHIKKFVGARFQNLEEAALWCGRVIRLMVEPLGVCQMAAGIKDCARSCVVFVCRFKAVSGPVNLYRRVEHNLFTIGEVAAAIITVTDVYLGPESKPLLKVMTFLRDAGESFVNMKFLPEDVEEVGGKIGEESAEWGAAGRLRRRPENIPPPVLEDIEGEEEEEEEAVRQEEEEDDEDIIVFKGASDSGEDSERLEAEFRPRPPGQELPAAAAVNKHEQEQVYPIFAIGDADFGQMDDLNQLRLSVGVGLAQTMALQGEGEQLSPRHVDHASVPAAAAPASSAAKSVPPPAGHEERKVVFALGDADFTQMSEEDKEMAATMFQRAEEDISFVMEIEVETEKVQASSKKDEASFIPSWVKNFTFDEPAEEKKEEEEEARGAEADDELEEEEHKEKEEERKKKEDKEESKRKKERVHELVHKFESFRSALMVRYTDENNIEHVQSLFVASSSDEDDECDHSRRRRRRPQKEEKEKEKEKKMEEEEGARGGVGPHNVREEVKRLLDEKLFQPQRSGELWRQKLRNHRQSEWGQGQEQGQGQEREAEDHRVSRYTLSVQTLRMDNPAIQRSRPTSGAQTPKEGNRRQGCTSAALSNLQKRLSDLKKQQEKQEKEEQDGESAEEDDEDTRKPPAQTPPPSPVAGGQIRSYSDTLAVTADVRSSSFKAWFTNLTTKLSGSEAKPAEKEQGDRDGEKTDRKNERHQSETGERKAEDAPEGQSLSTTARWSHSAPSLNQDELESQAVGGGERGESADSSPRLEHSSRSFSASLKSLSMSRTSLPAIPDNSQSSSDSDPEGAKVETSEGKPRSQSGGSEHKSTQTLEDGKGLECGRSQEEGEARAKPLQADAEREGAGALFSDSDHDTGIDSCDTLNSPHRDENDRECATSPVPEEFASGKLEGPGACYLRAYASEGAHDFGSASESACALSYSSDATSTLLASSSSCAALLESSSSSEALHTVRDMTPTETSSTKAEGDAHSRKPRIFTKEEDSNQDPQPPRLQRSRSLRHHSLSNLNGLLTDLQSLKAEKEEQEKTEEEDDEKE